MRTFELIDLDQAMVEIDACDGRTLATNLPEIAEYHPLALSPDGAVLCLHDSANERTESVFVDRVLLERLPDDEAAHEHFTRVARAVFN